MPTYYKGFKSFELSYMFLLFTRLFGYQLILVSADVSLYVKFPLSFIRSLFGYTAVTALTKLSSSLVASVPVGAVFRWAFLSFVHRKLSGAMIAWYSNDWRACYPGLALGDFDGFGDSLLPGESLRVHRSLIKRECSLTPWSPQNWTPAFAAHLSNDWIKCLFPDSYSSEPNDLNRDLLGFS